MLNLAILISGRGSNMEAILKTIRKKKIPANPAVVISNKPDAKGLRIAKKLGVKTEVVDSQDFKGDRVEYDKKIINGKMNFILLNKIGDAFISDKVTIDDIKKILEE